MKNEKMIGNLLRNEINIIFNLFQEFWINTEMYYFHFSISVTVIYSYYNTYIIYYYYSLYRQILSSTSEHILD